MEIPSQIRAGLRWFDSQRGARPWLETLRELLPGDSQFGDPLSTAGAAPAHQLARRAWSADGGRWSAVRELGLAALQVADWLNPASPRTPQPVAIVFTDLAGYSSWALRAGDEAALELLRSVDALVTTAFERCGGVVVKRLGDGTMAVFEDPPAAPSACADALRAVRTIVFDDYRPRLRTGIHVGCPHAIGGDYVGVDVNIAARLCEAADPDEILLSRATAAALESPSVAPRSNGTELRGVPADLGIYNFRWEAGSTEDNQSKGATDGGRNRPDHRNRR